MTDELSALRAELDEVDRALVDLLARRAALVGLVWQLKEAQGLAMRDLVREATMYAGLLARAEAAGLDGERVRAVFERIVGVDLLARRRDG